MIEALIAFVVFVGVLSFVSNPLLHKVRTIALTSEDTALRNLEHEKFNIYTQIKEADFEYEMGKLSYRDYRYQRQELMEKAAEIIDEIEQYSNGNTEHTTDTSTSEDGESRRCPECDSVVPPDAKFCTLCGTPLTGKHYCPECGAENPATGNFCSRCGEGLVTA